MVQDSQDSLSCVHKQDTLCAAYIVYPTGSTQEDKQSFRHDCKIVDWDVKHQHKQTDEELRLTLTPMGERIGSW